ncbi:hypothetical protein [Nocardioides speluncae]|uniref:hypothetical protein n=1 Tax=Nocardioides speluncae TaxID=2670337 RepID=UPI000D699E04|nr:hypothetical protein [Nocardioides speluncae]
MRRLAAIGMLLVLVACGEESVDLSDAVLPKASERVPITDRAIAAIGLEHLPERTKHRRSMDRGNQYVDAMGAELDYGEVSVQIMIEPAEGEADDMCEVAVDCIEVKAEDGTPMTLGWQAAEPEEDPGVVWVRVRRGDDEIRVSESGSVLTEEDPREQTLVVAAEDLIAAAGDPLLRLRTSPDAVAAGEELDDWEGGEPDPDARDIVPSTDRALAAAYLSTRGGYGEFSSIEPSPLKAMFGEGALGARLHGGGLGTAPIVIDWLATSQPPAWLKGDPCATDRFRGRCKEYAPFEEYEAGIAEMAPPLPPAPGPIYLMWTPTAPGVPGEVWAVQQRPDQLVAFHQTGFRVPARLAAVETAVEWAYLHQQLGVGTIGLQTTTEIAEDTSITRAWRE